MTKLIAFLYIEFFQLILKKNVFSIHVILLSIFFLTYYPNVQAGLQLDKVITYFEADKLRRQDILVTNTDKEKLFLETEIFKVENPGAETEERIKITDPDKFQLLATPDKNIIPPGGRKTVRLLHLTPPPKTEEVYRVTFRPVLGKLQATDSAVKIIIAYQVLVFIRPVKPFIAVSSKIQGQKITFTNKGNINVVLRNGRYCPAGVRSKKSHKKQQQGCKALNESHRIYAGQNWTLTLTELTKNDRGLVEYGLFDGKNEVTKQFPL